MRVEPQEESSKGHCGDCDVIVIPDDSIDTAIALSIDKECGVEQK